MSNGKKMKKEDFSTSDLEIDYLQKVLELSKKMNKSVKKEAIAGCPALQTVNRYCKIAEVADELNSL